MSNHAILDASVDLETRHSVGPSGLEDDQANSLFDQEAGGIMEEILREADSSKDFATARRKVFEIIEKGSLHEHREVLFQMVDKLEAGYKGTAQEKGKSRDPGERSKRNAEPEGDGNELERDRRRKKARIENSSDSSEEEDQVRSNPPVFGWSGRNATPKGSSGYRNLELAQKTNVLWQHYIKNKKSAL